jgi:hypothetical protein
MHSVIDLIMIRLSGTDLPMLSWQERVRRGCLLQTTIMDLGRNSHRMNPISLLLHVGSSLSPRVSVGPTLDEDGVTRIPVSATRHNYSLRIENAKLHVLGLNLVPTAIHFMSFEASKLLSYGVLYVGG